MDKALTRLRDLAVSVAASRVYAMSDSDLSATMAVVRAAMAALSAFGAALASEAAGRELPQSLGYSSTGSWLRHEHRLSRTEANATARLGSVLATRPALEEAVGSGTVSGEQAIVIGDAVAALSLRVDATIVDAAEKRLLCDAETFGPGELRLLAERVLTHVAPEIAEDELRRKLEEAERRAYADRGLTLHVDRVTQQTRVSGKLTAEMGAILAAALAPLSKQRPISTLRPGTAAGNPRAERRADAFGGANPDHDSFDQHGHAGLPVLPHAADDRTAPQRRADALIELCQMSSWVRTQPSHRAEHRAAQRADDGSSRDHAILAADHPATVDRSTTADRSTTDAVTTNAVTTNAVTTNAPEPRRRHHRCPHPSTQAGSPSDGWRSSRDSERPRFDAGPQIDASLADAPASRADGFESGAAQPANDAGAGIRRPTFHVNVTVDYDLLRQRLGVGMLDNGQLLTPESVRRMACDAQVLPAIMGGAGQVLDLGRSQRTWTGAARRAVILRDQGCVFPACDRPPDYCDIHHVAYWSRGGRTDLSNAALVCGFHHHLIHHSGWTLRVAADGLPEVIPPIHVDPLRRPLRNAYHRRL